ncbi:MAG: TrlF family AAA-like ATPase [Rhodomicrobium sp.]
MLSRPHSSLYRCSSSCCRRVWGRARREGADFFYGSLGLSKDRQDRKSADRRKFGQRGAHYYRCDLQVHTPRDMRWTGKECVTPEDRRVYADSLVQACRERKIQAIAITDHHDMAFAGLVGRAAAEETDEAGNPLAPEDRLVVFPGMELTLGVPCQALLIFDAAFPEDMFTLAMTALTINPSPPGDSRTAQITRLNHIHSLVQLKAELDKYAYLKERYIIFPNVGENGQFSLLRKGLAGKYAEMPCVGGYLDGEITKLGKGNQSIVAGAAKDWGHKRIALFQTSDNRCADHRDLGKSSTWIKWATPTAEALRQACLAQESRVSQEQPKLPVTIITGITVSNSTFLGPIELELNPQYNALIGGRGTGKSTILEYLRWALCDQPPDVTAEDAPNYQARRARLIEQTLKSVNASVDVRFLVNEVPHVVRRRAEDESLSIKVGADEFRECREDEVRMLLPIQAYSQKQLSDVSVRTGELMRFVTSPVRSQLRQLHSHIEESASRVRQSYTTRLRQRALAADIARRQLEQRSLQEQADAVRATLTDLSAEDRALLERGKSYETADAAVEAWLTDLRGLREEATVLQGTVRGDLGAAPKPPQEPHKEILTSAFKEYKAIMDEADRLLGQIIKKTDAAVTSVDQPDSGTAWANWRAESASFRAAYDAAVQRSSAQKERVEQLQEIEKRLSTHIRDTRKLQDELKSLRTAETVYAAQRQTWMMGLRAHDEMLDMQCKALTANAAGAIRASVRRFANTGGFVQRLRDALSGSNVRREKLEALGAAIEQADEPENRWKEIVDDLEKLGEFDPQRDGSERRPETPALTAAGMTPADLNRIAGRLSSDDWLSLSLVEIGSKPVFEYRSREGDYIEFENASAGQQATALLKSLLNQPGPPLIVDQPEEDLDNPVMPEIVEQLWWSKANRQIIFASHNANLVVNGDAELVVWCDYRKAGDQSLGKIAGEGAIDVPDMRDAIKRVMEGGEAAFKLRKEKYGF